MRRPLSRPRAPRGRSIALGLAAPAIALAAVVLPHDSPAEPRVTADGVQCNDSNFELNELSPSVFSANSFRLTQLLTLEQRVDWLCDDKWPGECAIRRTLLPGMEVVIGWRKEHRVLWPSPEDPKYLYERSILLQRESLVDGESRRAAAHLACLGRFSVQDAALQRFVGDGPRSSPDVAMCGALVNEERNANRILFARLDHVTERLSAEWRRWSAQPDGGKTDETLKRQREAFAFYYCLGLASTGQQDEKCQGLLSRGAFPWPRLTTGIFDAARQVIPSLPPEPPTTPAPPGSERAALVSNLNACPNADIYVSPTHDIVRHSVDEPVSEHLSLCVDTASFAVDQPIQAILSTPNAQQVEWLWPGEPLDIHLQTSFLARTQVVHLVVGGYPRRELLRDLARHSGGPLASEDIFDLIAKNTAIGKSAEAAASASTLAEGRAKLRQALVQDPDVGRDLICLDALIKVQAKHLSVDAAAKEICGEKNAEEAMRQLKQDFDVTLPSPSVVSWIKAGSVLLRDAVEGHAPEFDEPVLASLRLPSEQEIANATPARTMEIAIQLAGLLDGLSPPAREPVPSVASIAPRASEPDILCSLTSEVVPLVSEDILVKGRGEGKDPYVVEYDFGGGFQLATPGVLWDYQPIFFVVRNVAPGWSISVDTGRGTVVQRDLTLIGLTTNADPGGEAQTSERRDAFASVLPLSREMQPPSTHILSIGYPSGDVRRDVTVCASLGGTGCPTDATMANSSAVAGGAKPEAAPAPPASEKTPDAGPPKVAAANPAGTSSEPRPVWRIVGKNTIVVHSKHYLGVRAGLGAAASIGGFQTLGTDPYLNRPVVRRTSTSVDFALPLLLAWYPLGRDAVEMPGPFSYGFGGGLDLLKVGSTPRLYLGALVDIYGFGFTVALSTERVSYVAGEPGTVYPSASSAQVDEVWRPGGFIGVTTDLDIFVTAFRSYFDRAKFPVITGARSSR